MIEHALIMAAGRGNRMKPLTDLLPKAMIPYNGDTLIGASLQKLRNCVPHVHITVGYKKAMLAEYLMVKGVDTIINTEGHGNAWWIQNTVMKYMDDPVLTLTADNITEIDIAFLFQEYTRLGLPACMLVPVFPVKGVEGDFIEHIDGNVISLDRETLRDTYCSGIQVLNPVKIGRLVPEETENFNDVWEILITHQSLKTSTVYPKPWFSVDTLEQLTILSRKELEPVF